VANLTISIVPNERLKVVKNLNVCIQLH